MALQGDLQSFALNDVLRLLAGTSKSGRLAVAGSDRKGDLWLDGGRIAGGDVSSAPYATEVVDVVLELLRFGDGSFAFHDDETAPDTSASSRCGSTRWASTGPAAAVTGGLRPAITPRSGSTA